MISALSDFFKSENVEFFGALPIEECKIQKEYLFKNVGFVPKSVICFLVPYYTQDGINISKYAVSKDYHLFMKTFCEKLSDVLKNEFPQCEARGFSDHSPIYELEAAAKCGLGVIGENGLLINEKYSSFVFVGDVFTDLNAKTLGYIKAEKTKHCIKCGKCKKACPTGALLDYSQPCLSAITQKKGELNERELSLMIAHNTVWGCDICQNVCPYTANAIKNGTVKTPIEFFYEDRIHNLTLDTLDGMTEEVFSERAYAWRKRETIRRNLIMSEKVKAKNEEKQKNKK